jgi:hypothetical protein
VGPDTRILSLLGRFKYQMERHMPGLRVCAYLVRSVGRSYLVRDNESFYVNLELWFLS